MRLGQNFLADTNLLLRLADPVSPQHPIATDALARLLGQGDEVYLTPQNLIEFWAVATRPVEANGFGWGSERTTKEVTELQARFPLLPDSPEIFTRLQERKIDTAFVTLHVGAGTFAPVKSDRVEDHRVDRERYEISPSAAAAINSALDEGRRVVAVGTTTTRTLEAVARDHGGRVVAGDGATDLFIYPGFEFRIVGGLLTNFHLPKSSLLMLVAAFAGHDLVRTAYHEAIAERYRFYSYGDGMLIL